MGGLPLDKSRQLEIMSGDRDMDLYHRVGGYRFYWWQTTGFDPLKPLGWELRSATMLEF